MYYVVMNVFFKIPLEEYRKPIEEIKSQKRSQYRKRYELLDQYEQEIQEHMKYLIKISIRLYVYTLYVSRNYT